MAAAAGKNGGFSGSGKMAILAYYGKWRSAKPPIFRTTKMPIFGTTKKAAYFGWPKKRPKFRPPKTRFLGPGNKAAF